MGAHLSEVNDVFSDRPPPGGGRDGACYVATKWFRSEQAFPVRGWSRWVLAALSAAWLAGCGDEAVTPPQTPETPVTGSIVGRVSADGEGLPGVTVSAGGATTSTGSTGAYRFDNLPGGTHEVSISGHPSDVDFPSTTASATISSAGQTVTIDFAGMYIRTSGITGTVSVGGSSAAGLDLTLGGTETKTAQTDDAGQYAFENLRAGSYVVRISFDAEEFSFDRTSAEVVLGTGDSATVDFQGVSLAAERQALIALLDATGGTWADALGWSADRPVSEWGGVETDSTGAVTGLELSGVGMEGELPPELGKLTRLKVLNASSNRLTGSIPKELRNLLKGSLAALNLSDNDLTGNLNRLLVPGDTSLVSPPDSIARAANADTASNTIALTHFDASGNRLTGEIPPEVGLAAGLQVFDVGDNGLSGEIPAELGNLSNLEVLNLAGNELTGEIPPEVGLATGLEIFDVSRNGLTGAIPAELGTLSNLRRLNLQSNQLTGSIPPELGGLSNLEALILGANSLTGTIPPQLGGLSNLQELTLGNALTGSIPPELGNLESLELLSLSGNLTGSVPPELGSLESLEQLDLGFNQLTGSIPPELGNLESLRYLGLQFNQLTGSIPPELGGLESLEELHLSGNQLTGAIPVELARLDSLRILYVSDNDLCVPRSDSAFVAWLNGLTHHGTDGLRSCTSRESDRATLEIFYHATGGDDWTDNTNWLNDDVPLNDWHGVVADTLDRVFRLEFKDSGNQLTGSIPPEIGSLESLELLSLSANQLTGSIPPELGNLESLEWLYLGFNQLMGSIPPELGSLESLEGLALHENQLTGSIPPELGSLESLGDLYLSDNQLTGAIPVELAGLDSLRILYVSDNDLCVPRSDSAFVTWLNGLTYHDTDGLLSCTSTASDRATLEIFYHATGGDDWTDNTNWLNDDVPLNDWHGVVADTLDRVFALDLRDNQLTGSIPRELGNLESPARLDLNYNQLTGSIAPELGNLESLDTLDLGNNQLTGSIPAELGNLESLWVLGLGNNQLTGSIPPELGNLESLVELYLRDNQLTGSIPPELGNLESLRFLFLYDNQLTGSIPPELGNLESLWSLQLTNNQLTGSIPPDLGSLGSLAVLFLDNNQLTGAIPPELGGLSNLTRLLIHHNEGLRGVLPHSLVSLVNLQQFWFFETSLCARYDEPFVAWMQAVEARSTGEHDTVRGFYCDPATYLRDDFSTRASLENWALGNSHTSAGVDNGLLYLSNTNAEWAALVYHAFADGVSATDWRVTARIAREGDDVRMIIWLFMDHDVYQHYRFEIGSGYDVDDRDTNYRFFAWNDNRDGPGEGGWVFFSDFGHGVSDAVNDGVVEFNEVDYSIIDGALSMNVNGTTVAGPAVLQRDLATDIVGIGLASANARGGEYATTLFDWVELNGVLLGVTAGGEVDGAHIPPEVADRIRRLEARLAAGDVKEERMQRGSR